jgi:hypothetical protein
VQHLTCADCGDTASVEAFHIDPADQQLVADVPACPACASPYLDSATDVVRLDDPGAELVDVDELAARQTVLDLDDIAELGA